MQPEYLKFFEEAINISYKETPKNLQEEEELVRDYRKFPHLITNTTECKSATGQRSDKNIANQRALSLSPSISY